MAEQPEADEVGRGGSPPASREAGAEPEGNVGAAGGAPRPAEPHGDPDAIVFRALLDAVRDGRPTVLATVVDARGSTPRGVGSRMLIDPEGGLVGTIGGGCGEGEVIAAAGEVVASGEPRLLRVQLTDDMDSWSPAICGGVMDVLLEPVQGPASTN